VQKSPAFRVIPVAPLTPGDYAPFISKLGITAVQAVQIREAIRKSPSKLTTLISTPSPTAHREAETAKAHRG